MEYKPFKDIGELEDFLKKSRGKKWKEVNQKGLEEWRVELRKLMFYDRTQLAEASFNKPYTGEYQEKAEELISQLLSERAREAKQEVIDDIWEEARDLASWDEHDGVIPISQVENCLPEAIKNIEESLSKLLKEKENGN